MCMCKMYVKYIYYKNIIGYYIYMNRFIRIWNRFEEFFILDFMCYGNILNKLLCFEEKKFRGIWLIKVIFYFIIELY